MPPTSVRIAVVLLLAGAAVAGCTSDPSTPAAGQDGTKDLASANPQSSSSPKSAAGPASTVGTIRGSVTTDELFPVDNATVAILALEVEVKTARDGTYRFLNVPEGTYELAADRPGFQGQAITVKVQGGDDARADFQLAPVPVEAPFIEVLNHVAIHHYTTGWAAWAGTSYINDTFESACEKCRWVFTTQGRPLSILFEIGGEHAISNPLGQDSELWYLYGYANETIDEVIWYDTESLPAYHSFTGGLVSEYDAFVVMSMCELNWVCVEERRDYWISVFHDAEIPEGYAVRPKA